MKFMFYRNQGQIGPLCSYQRGSCIKNGTAVARRCDSPASTLPVIAFSRGRFATGFLRCAPSSPLAPASTLPLFVERLGDSIAYGKIIYVHSILIPMWVSNRSLLRPSASISSIQFFPNSFNEHVLPPCSPPPIHLSSALWISVLSTFLSMYQGPLPSVETHVTISFDSV
jgi:hypothetical protein